LISLNFAFVAYCGDKKSKQAGHETMTLKEVGIRQSTDHGPITSLFLDENDQTLMPMRRKRRHEFLEKEIAIGK
jgi:hypothetical protein